MIRIADLEKIIKMVENHDISHFAFEQDSSRVVIEKNECSSAEYEYKGNTKKAASDADDKDIIDEAKETCEEERAGEESTCSSNVIKSSLAGTFYLQKDKDAEPFVKIGDEVSEDTLVGVVEVMKLFNEIEAGAEGKISKILVKDGEFVEYGQPLFELN